MTNAQMIDDLVREGMIATAPAKKGQSAWNYHRRPTGRINHDRVVSLKAGGMTNRQIADAVFCEIETVQQILRTNRMNGGAA